ncbi:hypothetical protein Pint_26278 [Pistacia integerrima]|uniref:Uncharacterized protein n=1 Tax=Pistacia integerrima TaxID=434235 RepID=A0ACC0YG93_9ROSI|nr:hypothetical protein Pint_26278 [Pistacia integerrima]
MAFLPQEILFQDILPKLPVKSICRLKCVSKSFMALFNDPLFIKTHQSQTHRDKLLILPNSDLYLIDPKTSSNDEKLTTKGLNFSKDGSIFFCSCNGLCCLYVSQRCVCFFYNPSTRECSKEIPIPNHINEDKCLDIPVVDGFGYASYIDDYKMVILSYWECLTHIFSLKNNSWKRIHQYEEKLLGTTTLVNGALHWLNYSAEKILSIVSFDLVEEKFKSFPPLPDYFQSCSTTLYVMDCCLCMLVTKIWVMKEYGVVDSWTRILISKEHHQKPIYQSKYLSVKAFREALVSPNCYIGEAINDS